MTYKLSSGRRYLNNELVDPPQLGPWTEADLFPEWDSEDLFTLGLYDIDADEDEWDEINDWLLTLDDSPFPVTFLIERCCDDGELLPEDIRETRLKDFPRHWVSACQTALNDAPEPFAEDLFFVIFWSVRIERARRLATATPAREKRSTLEMHHGRASNQLDMFKPIYWND